MFNIELTVEPTSCEEILKACLLLTHRLAKILCMRVFFLRNLGFFHPVKSPFLPLIKQFDRYFLFIHVHISKQFPF